MVSLFVGFSNYASKYNMFHGVQATFNKAFKSAMEGKNIHAIIIGFPWTVKGELLCGLYTAALGQLQQGYFPEICTGIEPAGVNTKDPWQVIWHQKRTVWINITLPFQAAKSLPLQPFTDNVKSPPLCIQLGQRA
jgi:hypothetical protein